MDKNEKIKELLTRGVEQVIVSDSLRKKLSSDAKLRVKLGVDPTAPRLHLGHTVVLRKLKQFMELGHKIIFLFGDFTARIGDPSDKLSARQPLTEKEINKNVKTYRGQVGKVLDLSKVEFRYNSEWHKNMDFTELFRLASLFTVNQMLERDMFQKRLAQKKPLWVHELMYPILQGYDSVALRADVELGGTDQTFNVLAARVIQPAYDQPLQDIMTVSLLEGTDGQAKMSKSVGNTIDLTDSPRDMYGKTMSLPDQLIIKYFLLCTDVPVAEITQYQKELKSGANPRDYKAKLAQSLVQSYHGSVLAKKAASEFKEIFSKKGQPNKVAEVVLSAGISNSEAVAGLFQVSKSAARRLIQQGGVRVNDKLLKDPQAVAKPGIYKKGRHFRELATSKK